VVEPAGLRVLKVNISPVQNAMAVANVQPVKEKAKFLFANGGKFHIKNISEKGS
jgi:hypothetical protein